MPLPAGMPETSRPAKGAAKGMPFIMPDGRPLGTFLADANLLRPSFLRRRGGRKRGGAARARHAQGWSTAARPSAAPPAAADRTPAEEAEAAALARVGRRKTLRWLNDKLLRDMVPALTAKDMESLFKPAPFGEERVSTFSLAAAPEVAPLWDLFRTIDSDRQGRVLVKWEEHVRELRREAAHEGGGGGAPSRDAAADAALAAWAAVEPGARRALRRAPRACVEELEAEVGAFASSASAGEELVMEPETPFLRLLVHGLAQFHGLQSFGRDGPGGGRQVVARRRRAPAGAAAPQAAAVTCGDVLWLLESGADLTASAVRAEFTGEQAAPLFLAAA
jgi:hypothetical protein